jgi:hypothetical protein
LAAVGDAFVDIAVTVIVFAVTDFFLGFDHAFAFAPDPGPAGLLSLFADSFVLSAGTDATIDALTGLFVCLTITVVVCSVVANFGSTREDLFVVVVAIFIFGPAVFVKVSKNTISALANMGVFAIGVFVAFVVLVDDGRVTAVKPGKTEKQQESDELEKSD